MIDFFVWCVDVVVVVVAVECLIDFVADLNAFVSIDVYDVLLNSLKRNVADDTKTTTTTTKKKRTTKTTMRTRSMLCLLRENLLKQVVNLNDWQ